VNVAGAVVPREMTRPWLTAGYSQLPPGRQSEPYDEAVSTPRIKFCGVTGLDDAQRAAEAGAWAVGLILWPGSPRRCALPDAERIVAALRRQVEIAGVFVNAPLDEVIGVAEGVGLTIVQLHGDEGPAFCGEVARRTGAKVIKAARVRERADLQDLARFHTDYHLVDAYVPGTPGGTGETFDWQLVAGRDSQIPLILSGGLTPENVAAGIAATNPDVVDVASGTEASPGRKDPEKLVAFAAAVRAVAEQAAAEAEAAAAAEADAEADAAAPAP
jgi:phosphoribosylanthranilate isomerase